VLIGRAMASLERRGADGRLEWGNSVPPTNGELGGSIGGTTVSEKTALQVAAVYGSVGVLCDSMATLPFHLYSSLDPAKRRRLPPTWLLTQPYSEISRVDWIVQFTMSLALRGNFYGQIVERDEDLYPTQIKPVHPDHTMVRRLPNGRPEYRLNGKVVFTDDVWHVRYLSVPGSLVGLNPIEYLRYTIGLARAQDLYGTAFFSNDATPGGTIEVQGDLDSDETLKLARGWAQAHQGVGKARLPAVLTNGAKFNSISITPEDAQFLESRGFTEQQICGRIFRIPPHMVGIVDKSTSWGRGIEQQERGFVTNTLSGYIGRLEEGLTGLHPGRFVRADLDQRLRGDRLSRAQAQSLGRLGGWLCADDIRAEEDMPPVPPSPKDPEQAPGQAFVLPINTETLQQALTASFSTPPSDGGIDDQQGGGNANG
jgi:HK97 family phage portal protein